ncbi:MAG TPA: hypothetical protein VMV56_11800 [Williamwhitmania sp.]|nr:hypothetical protein [Williamwhitmania sp.]
MGKLRLINQKISWLKSFATTLNAANKTTNATITGFAAAERKAFSKGLIVKEVIEENLSQYYSSSNTLSQSVD